MTSILTITHIFIFLGHSEFPSWLAWQPIQILQYPKSIQQTASMLCGITHLPNFELVGVDVVECILLLLLDCFLQVIDSFRQQYVNRKAVCFVEAENPTVE